MKDKVKFAFYKPTKKDIWGNIISLYTGIWNIKTPSYAHVEIGFLIDGKWKYYSSASRNTNGTTGTRWLDEETLLEHKERWDIYEVEPVLSQKLMVSLCERELGKAYDWYGIAGFATLFGQLNSKARWYCSEICNYVFFGSWKKRISPRGLFAKLKSYTDIKKEA